MPGSRSFLPRENQAVSKPSVTKNHFALPLDAELARYHGFVRGYSYELLQDPPAKEWHWETQTVDQVATVLSGELAVDIDGGAVVLGPGDEAFIPAGCWHRARNASETQPCQWLFGYDGARSGESS